MLGLLLQCKCPQKHFRITSSYHPLLDAFTHTHIHKQPSASHFSWLFHAGCMRHILLPEPDQALYICALVLVCAYSRHLFCLQNLKVKGPKESKDCTTSTTMEGKSVSIDLWCVWHAWANRIYTMWAWICFFVIWCVDWWYIARVNCHVCASELWAVSLKNEFSSASFYLCMQHPQLKCVWGRVCACSFWVFWSVGEQECTTLSLLLLCPCLWGMDKRGCRMRRK